MTEIIKAPEADLPPVGTSPHEPCSVLLVDDRPENLLALEAALEPLGQNLIRASSGEEALRILLKEEIAVIILDVQMPGLDGFETAAYVKQLDRTKHIPIIFLTAINKEIQHVFRGYSAGAVDYLFKPFDPLVLGAKVHVFIELHQKTRALQASEERFRRTFDHAPIGVALVGLDGGLIKVNNALCELMGYSQAEMIGQTIRDLIHPDEAPIEPEQLVSELRMTGASRHLERRLATRYQAEKHALVSVSFIHGAANLGPHFIFQITDITERRQLEEFRERFVSHAAHELRTPATVIAGTATLLHESRQGMTEPELEQCVTALNRQAQRLTTMVANLLDLARLKEGGGEANLEPIELRELATQVIEHTPPPETTTVRMGIAKGDRVMADPEGLDHILSNLLVNAYRYGGPSVEVRTERQNGEMVMSVLDDGQGVPKELVPRLFEPFTRGKTSSSVGGSGLGLALVKSLVETSGGRIDYEPRAGGGACFKVSLPVPE